MFSEISQNSQENTGARASFLITLTNSLKKKNSGTDVFLWILWNFWEHLCWYYYQCWYYQPMLILLPIFHSDLNHELKLSVDLQTIIKVSLNCYRKHVILKLWNTETVFLKYCLLKLQSIARVNMNISLGIFQWHICF